MRNPAINFFIIISSFSMQNMIAQNSSVDFGKQFTQEIMMPNAYTLITDVQLEKLDKKFSKQYYQNLTTSNGNWTTDGALLWKQKEAAKVDILFKPLNPNQFYRLKIQYYDSDNIYALMLMIHKEGIEDWYTKEKNWMKALKLLDNKYGKFKLTYTPKKAEVLTYKADIAGFNFAGTLSEQERTRLKGITLADFKNLNFRANDLNIDRVISFAKQIQSAPAIGLAEISLLESIVMSVYDYQGIYDFYFNYFKYYLENNEFDTANFIALFPVGVVAEKTRLTAIGEPLVPNYLDFVKNDILVVRPQPFTTYPITFQASYERTLVPDFGYIVYPNASNDLNGGSTFVGVNISLSPVNKDLPLSLSRLSFVQRLSIHTGISLTSLKEDGKRVDFFKDNSLMAGIGYKVFCQALRINFGGVFYKKIDPLTQDKKIAVQPYIGLSIDIEIKKWLSGLVPSLTNNF